MTNVYFRSLKKTPSDHLNGILGNLSAVEFVKTFIFDLINDITPSVFRINHNWVYAL